MALFHEQLNEQSEQPTDNKEKNDVLYTSDADMLKMQTEMQTAILQKETKYKNTVEKKYAKTMESMDLSVDNFANTNIDITKPGREKTVLKDSTDLIQRIQGKNYTELQANEQAGAHATIYAQILAQCVASPGAFDPNSLDITKIQEIFPGYPEENVKALAYIIAANQSAIKEQHNQAIQYNTSPGVSPDVQYGTTTTNTETNTAENPIMTAMRGIGSSLWSGITTLTNGGITGANKIGSAFSKEGLGTGIAVAGGLLAGVGLSRRFGGGGGESSKKTKDNDGRSWGDIAKRGAIGLGGLAIVGGIGNATGVDKINTANTAQTNNTTANNAPAYSK